MTSLDHHPPVTARLSSWAFAVVVTVAAVISFDHIRLTAGDHWWAVLIPLSVDGLMISGSIALWADRSAGRSGSLLAWTAVLAGLFVSLWANVAQADPSPTGVVVAMWPPLALAVAFELLIRSGRAHDPAEPKARPEPTAEPRPAPPQAPTERAVTPSPVRPVGSSTAARARDWVRAELAEGREPTGADVDAHLGLQGRARCGARAVRQVLDERVS